MAEIINLRRHIKGKQRDERARLATANAAKHGRTKEERALEQARADKLIKDLDDHKRDDL